MPPSSGTLTIAPAILVPQDRIPRRPLGAWAVELAEKLSAARRTARRTHALAGALAGIGNQAALISASRGDVAAAWRLTERQLWWHGRQARRAKDPAVAAWALQPWVNLGRLESLTGRWGEALARFAGLTGFAVANRLELGCVRVSGTAWRALVGSRDEFLSFLETIFVPDSLRAMLLNRRWELVEPFAARFGGQGEMRCVCEEACIVALCREGDARSAAARARAAARNARGWNRAVFQLRAAEACAGAGDAATAEGMLRSLASVVRQASPERKDAPQLLPFLARLAGASLQVGLASDAYALAEDLLRSARAADDEPTQIEALRLLAAAASHDVRERWENETRTLEEQTEYARYHCGVLPQPGAAITGLFEQLETTFSS